MANNFCGNCGKSISGNFCGDCGSAVKAIESDRHMMDRDTGVNENLDQNNRTQFVSSPGLPPHRNFAAWLLLILFIPPFGQIIYTLEVMKDFKNHLWPTLQADSKLELGSKEVKARSTAFYVMILTLPPLAVSLYVVLLNLTPFFLNLLIGGDDGNNLSDSTTALFIFLIIQFVIIPILIALIFLIAPTFYIYHKHIILSQFIELRYESNTHHSEYPSVNPSIFRVREKPLVFLGIACASIISYVIAFVILFNIFALQATFIAFAIGVLLWLISVVVWLFYEKIWHDTMYDLIRFENFMKRKQLRQSQP